MSGIDRMNGFLDWYYKTVKSTKVITNEVFIQILEKFDKINSNMTESKLLPTGVTCINNDGKIEVIMPSLENRSEMYKRVAKECLKKNLSL